MTEEEIKALKEEKEEAEKNLKEAKEALENMQGETEKARQDREKVVEELKSERQKKQEALEKAGINNQTPDVDSLVEQALQKKEKERREKEMEEAVAEFKNSKTEFQSDSSGVVFDKFKEGLKRFNFSDVDSKETAKKRLEEAYEFLNKKNGEEGDGGSYEGSPQTGPNVPETPDSISATSKQVMEGTNIDEEKFKKLQGKYGDAFEGLGIK